MIQYYNQFFEKGQQVINFNFYNLGLSADDPVYTLINILEDFDFSSLLARYSNKGRKGYNPNRAHLIFGIRNTIMGCMGPDITMCGPLWAAMQVVVCERYKKGKESMQSIFGGAASFRFGTLTGYFLLPIVTLVTPILPIALALTMIVQGFVSVRIGALQAKSFTDLGIAGIIGGVLLAKGSAYALGIGIVCCILAYGKDFVKGDVNFGHLWSQEVELLTAEEETL